MDKQQKYILKFLRKNMIFAYSNSYFNHIIIKIFSSTQGHAYMSQISFIIYIKHNYFDYFLSFY